MSVKMNSFSAILHIEDANTHGLWDFASEGETPIPAHELFVRYVGGGGAILCNEDGSGQFQIMQGGEAAQFQLPAGTQMFVKLDGSYVDLEVMAISG